MFHYDQVLLPQNQYCAVGIFLKDQEEFGKEVTLMDDLYAPIKAFIWNFKKEAIAANLTPYSLQIFLTEFGFI